MLLSCSGAINGSADFLSQNNPQRIELNCTGTEDHLSECHLNANVEAGSCSFTDNAYVVCQGWCAHTIIVDT